MSQPKAKKFKKENNEEKVLKRLEEVQKIQKELDEINNKASEEMLKIEQEYNKLREPLWKKRSELLKTIDNFWGQVFTNHVVFRAFLSNKDLEILKYLTDVEVKEASDIKSGNTIYFRFKENPFIENKELFKQTKFNEDGTVEHKTSGIKWKKEKKEEKKKKKEKKKKRKAEEMEDDQESFFSWFEEGSVYYTEDQLGELINEIWVNPLQYLEESEDEEDEEEKEE